MIVLFFNVTCKFDMKSDIGQSPTVLIFRIEETVPHDMAIRPWPVHLISNM